MAVEMRWKRPSGTTTNPDILQYRHTIERVSTSGVIGMQSSCWSEWQDVPVHIDDKRDES